MSTKTKLPKTVTCPICGATMFFGVWAVAEIPAPPATAGGDLIEDTAWFCAPREDNDGCCAILIPAVTPQ